eukprot:TRINITY_DN10382_c0_g4_i1.p1 TRINITY_DN10382_c0_g4~~TRINITY_DN10382_c0_g4_i1.p1  ORF type:complete len:341 (+),score=54.15 TRINITY_DN10382_c0_g4_i1:102-1025(+)
MSNETFLITGASSGIGLELCRHLLQNRQDATIIATCRNRKPSMANAPDQLSALLESSSSTNSKFLILDGIDVADDTVGSVLSEKLAQNNITSLDVVIHNAGSAAGHSESRAEGDNPMASQTLDLIDTDTMRKAFEVNTLGPLRVQKAITGLLKMKNSCKPDSIGKVVIVSTGMSSISDNGSGGIYAYRVSKAGVNMLGKCFAADLNKSSAESTGSEVPRPICCCSVAPGFVQTEFGPGKETMAKWGAKPVEQAVKGIVECIDKKMLDSKLSKDGVKWAEGGGEDGSGSNGRFWCVESKSGELVEFGW